MHGKPIVATRDGGMEQLLGNDYPYLVDHGNKTQIIDNLVKLLNNDEEARRIGKQNLAVFMNYTYERVASQLMEVYRQVIR